MSNWENILKVQVLDTSTSISTINEPMIDDDRNCCQEAFEAFEELICDNLHSDEQIDGPLDEISGKILDLMKKDLDLGMSPCMTNGELSSEFWTEEKCEALELIIDKAFDYYWEAFSGGLHPQWKFWSSCEKIKKIFMAWDGCENE
tara:strand:+ start:92 stop:529 length:438 start_codon:yes stop_codon:yes gene_type:complete